MRRCRCSSGLRIGSTNSTPTWTPPDFDVRDWKAELESGTCVASLG